MNDLLIVFGCVHQIHIKIYILRKDSTVSCARVAELVQEPVLVRVLVRVPGTY